MISGTVNAISVIAMRELLVCSYDPIFIKSLGGLIRQEGYEMLVADHPALAVRMAFERPLAAVIMDSEVIGFSAGDAASALTNSFEHLTVIISGRTKAPSGALSISKPLDLQEVKDLLAGLRGVQELTERRA